MVAVKDQKAAVDVATVGSEMENSCSFSSSDSLVSAANKAVGADAEKVDRAGCEAKELLGATKASAKDSKDRTTTTRRILAMN